MKHLLLILLLAPSFVQAETFWVRPKNSLTCQTTCAGLSYSDAFNGISDISWGSGAGQVGPGDTLRICGDFDRTTEGRTNLIDLSVSGTETDPIVITGVCDEGAPGRLWGSRRIDTDAWTDAGNGVFSTAWAYSTEFAAEGSIGSEQLLRTLNSLELVQSTNGSIYHDATNGLLYYNPTSEPQTVWANWTSAIAAHGNDYYVIENLVLRGGRSGEHAVLELTGNESAGPANNLVIRNNDIAFGISQLLECYDGCDNLVFSDNVMHDAPVGTYPCRGQVTCRNQSYLRNEIFSGPDVNNIYYQTEADRHALGGQSISDSVFDGNYIHDWAGDGINIWVKANQYGRNNVIKNNRIVRLKDAANAYYHRGVALNGSNELGKGNYTSGWKIYNNYFSELSGGLGEVDEGVAIRVKSQVDSQGKSVEIYNNTIEDSYYGIWFRENTADLTLGGDARNNNISVSGANILVDRGGTGAVVNVNFDNNAYGPAAFLYRGVTYPFSGWKTVIGGCPNANNDCSSVQTTANSPEELADLGVAIQGRNEDIDGNPIYGLPDIGALEYVPVLQTGIDLFDLTGSPRLYGDMKFRHRAATSSSPVSLALTPSGATTTWLDITFSQWAEHEKSWTEQSPTPPASLLRSVCGFGELTQYTLVVATEDDVKTSVIGSDQDGCYDISDSTAYQLASFTFYPLSPVPSTPVVSWTDGCVISWQAVSGRIDGYQLEVGGKKTKIRSTQTSSPCDVAGAVPGDNAVRLRSYYKDAYSPWSDQAVFSYAN